MSILQADILDAQVFDLFAGTGALGLEALSRGAAHVDFVEHHPDSLRALDANIGALGAAQRCTVHRDDVFRFLERAGTPHGVVFADPPYRLGLAARLAARWLQEPFAAIFGVEHHARELLPDGGDLRRYGDTAITLFRR